MNSQVVTVLDTSMAAAMPLAKPRKPIAHPSPMGKNHRQYLGMASLGVGQHLHKGAVDVEHHRQHPAGNPRRMAPAPIRTPHSRVPAASVCHKFRFPLPPLPVRRSLHPSWVPCGLIMIALPQNFAIRSASSLEKIPGFRQRPTPLCGNSQNQCPFAWIFLCRIPLFTFPVLPDKLLRTVIE